MPVDELVTEVLSTSWLGRVVESFVGVLIGFVCIIAAFPLIFWNEHNAVDMAKALKEGRSAVITISDASVNPENEGRLVHTIGFATTNETLADKDFYVTAEALKLKRTVSMLQWQEYETEETKKEFGGKETTTVTYTYGKVWSETPIDSTHFKKPEGHANPAFGPYRSQEQSAKLVTIGAFRLPPSLVAALGDDEKIDAAVPASLRGKATAVNGEIYLGQDPNTQRIGDRRIAFSQVKPMVVSLYAAQLGSTFEPYVTEVGKAVERIEPGEHSAASMFHEAAAESRAETWAYRVGFFILMFSGFMLTFKPISVVLSVLPFLGDVAEWGTAFFAFFLALTCTLVAIAIAWLVFRPVLGGALLAGALALFFGVGRYKITKRAS